MSTPRVGCKYTFKSVLMDRGLFPEGSVVKVVPIPGMRGTMPSMFRHVEYEGRIAMVCSASLTPTKRRRMSAMDEAADACGLKKVRGALGGIYYE